MAKRLPGGAGAGRDRREMVAADPARPVPQGTVALPGSSRAGLPGVAPNTLSARLKTLEAEGVIAHPALREPSAALRIFPDRQGQGARPRAQGAAQLGRALRLDRASSQIDSVREHKPLKSNSHRFCRRADDGVDRPPLPLFPAAHLEADVSLYRDGDGGGRAVWRSRARARLLRRPSIRSRCSSAAAMPRSSPRRRGSAPTSAMTRSTSMSAVRRTACSRAGSAPA